MAHSRDRDTLFPSGSVGRGASSQLQRVASHESLNAHPLLSPSPTASASTQSNSPESTLPRYVPYTPRQRPPTSPATTGTSMQSTIPVASHLQQGGATSKLQLQNLKAAAQSIGLGNGTVGWALLERLVDGETGTEWDEIWNIMINSKPTLLLPLEPYSGEIITPEFVKDHVAICSTTSPSPLVTLSGLRGVTVSGTLTIQSTLPTTSKPFVDLLKPEHQTTVLASLPPLPSLTNTSQHSLPSFVLPGSTTLPIPPRFHNTKPPLPPRPGSTTVAKVPTGRISNPFASLFGRPATPAASNTMVGTLSPSPSVAIELAAFSVGKKIGKKTIGKDLSKVIRDEIKAGLLSCPRWVVDRVIDFTGPLHPIPKAAKRIEVRGPGASSNRTPLPAISFNSDPSVLADAFQALYASIEGDLHAGSPLFGRWQDRDETRSQTESEVDEDPTIPPVKEEKVKETDKQTRIKEILERVETVVCEIFYDRIFCPFSGDDASHDGALANRIAALYMLDLRLEHLGVEIPNETVGANVQNVVKTCGAVLQRLEEVAYRSPARKAALLIEAHKEVVDGLSRLPKLRLKPEEEEHDLKTPRASSFPTQTAEEPLQEPSPPATATPPVELTVTIGSVEQSIGSSSEQNIIASPQEIEDHLNTSLPDTDLPSTPTPVSGDLLFPFLIYSVVKANPAHLVSHLLYTQRFRSLNAEGQERYCLINLMAVVEFLENVDMGALGLGDSDRVMSTADLSPIPLDHGSVDSQTVASSPFSTRIGQRVNQQVEELAELAGSANKVLTGVVDSSFGVLRGILGATPDLATPHGEVPDGVPWNSIKPGFGLLKRGSSFSIGGMSVSGRPKTPAGGEEEGGRPLVAVSSRPGSIKETNVGEEEGEEGGTNSDEGVEEDERNRGDTRSVRSFSSMMSKESRTRDRDVERGEGRASLADRLATMSGRTKVACSTEPPASPPPSQPTSRPTSWLPPPATQPDGGSITPAPPKMRIPPPNRRFMDCAEQDIRVGEVGELLREYRRMAQALRAAGFFEEQ
ncbi:hypothetical protein BU17DRAFT_54371 [Hysterangium stoloniferum]|nr:hypothetical protein BU17DRAFT_54371 [Hysterangium stoloniferum]